MLNKCYSYLLPLFNEECTIDGDYFIMLNNVYTRYNDELGYFVICYENDDNAEFLKYIQTLHENYLFVESFNDDELIYMVFNFPEEYAHEYDCYLNGKFSVFRDSSKLIILDYILGIHKTTSAENIRKVLYKEKELRESLEFKLGLTLSKDLELSSIPDIGLETCYNLKKCTQE